MAERKFYVSMTDRFLSGWGKAEDKISKYIIGCDTMEEALVIKGNALDRGDMRCVKIHESKPVFNTENVLSTWRDKEDCKNWLEKDYFKE